MLALAICDTQALVQDARQTQLKWLRKILKDHGLTPNALAEMTGGINASTLYRFLDDKSDSVLRPVTIGRIAQAVDAQLPAGMAFKEGEATSFDYDAEMFHVERFTQERGRIALMISGDKLQGAGLDAGDVVIVDTDREAEPGNLVVAQVYDLRRGTAETVIRYYHPPYLISPSDRPDQRVPLMIDHETVQVRGVVIRQLRDRVVA